MERKNIINAIANYAKENDIRLNGNSYKTYSMLKYPAQHFPDGTMFLSNNIRGEKGKQSVIIVACNENTVGHFQAENVLERPIEQHFDRHARMHRYIAHTYDMSISF